MSVVVPSRPRRTTELVLLFIALAVAIGAFMLANIGMEHEIAVSDILFSGWLAVLAFGLHVIIRIRLPYSDPYILPIAVALNGLGVAVIHRLDLTKKEPTDFATNQLVWTTVAMAVAGALIWYLHDHRILRRWTYLFLVASGVLLALPLIPGLGMTINGSRIWIGIAGVVSFQPGELVKITLAIFFAGYLSANRDLILLAGKKVGPVTFPRFRDLAPLIIAWLMSLAVMVFQTDLGSAILFFGLFMALLYMATSRISWILIGLVMAGLGALLAISFFSHVQARITGWLHAFDPEIYNAPGGSHQVVQGLFGLSSGGLLGTGLGQGRPDLVYAANSDSIVATMGEELGLVGLAAIIMLFMLMVTRMLRAALGARDSFGKLLAGGLAVIITLQCFIVMGGIFRVIPLTGLTTPFMAAGGSSLLSNWILVALVMIISQAARQPVVVGPMVNASGSGSGFADRAMPVEDYQPTAIPAGGEK